MSRLIDAGVLLDKVLRFYTDQEKIGNFQFVACEIKQTFADMIIDAPTIEAGPVRHGRWIAYLDGDHIMPERYYRCSECGRVERRKEPYCHCGAKMDGEE